MDKEPEYLNAVQAAKYLGISRPRIYELAKAGRIGRHVAGFWLFTAAELDTFKQERAQRPKGGRPKSAAGTQKQASPAS
jgi:excisionase family DNA binding protein